MEKFLELNEKPVRRAVVSYGSAFVTLHKDMVEWMVLTKRPTKRKKSKEGATYRPLKWEVEGELHFNLPGLRVELMNMINWS